MLPYAPSISFSSQAEIDAFPLNYPGCTTVTGDVLINGPNIINLNGLAQINTIEGNLDILFNPALTSLIGLDAVTFIGGKPFT
jgi:hypothetical protein